MVILLAAFLVTSPAPRWLFEQDRPATSGKTELVAKHWFNNPPFRLHDERDVVLFFFDPRDGQSADWATRLNRLSRNPGIVVIGLTRDDRADAERFIEKQRVRFTVGAGSQCARDFGVARLPQVLIRRHNGPEEPQRVDLNELESAGAPGLLSPTDVSGLTETWQLVNIVDSNIDSAVRLAAMLRLGELCSANEPDQLVELAESRLPREPDPLIRARLEYHRDLATGTPRDDDRPPSRDAMHRFRADPDAAEWAEARRFRDITPEELGSPQRAHEEYRRRLTDDPGDLLVRTFITQQTGRFAGDPTAREVLMQILRDGESDAAVRLNAIASLQRLGRPRDSEVGALLLQLAATEANALHVRPTLQWAGYGLQTGEWDTNRWPVPPP